MNRLDVMIEVGGIPEMIEVKGVGMIETGIPEMIEVKGVGMIETGIPEMIEVKGVGMIETGIPEMIEVKGVGMIETGIPEMIEVKGVGMIETGIPEMIEVKGVGMIETGIPEMIEVKGVGMIETGIPEMIEVKGVGMIETGIPEMIEVKGVGMIETGIPEMIEVKGVGMIETGIPEMIEVKGVGMIETGIPEMIEVKGVGMIETGKAEIENIKKEQVQKIKREKSLEKDNRSFFWIKSEGQRKIATENLVPGNQVYKEKLVMEKGIEYRLWDPFRSKLAASVMNKLEEFPFENKTKVLYLGASTGTTVSHISDIVGPSGIIFSVEHASRVARDFLDRVASHRTNIIPILQDARRPKEYFAVFGKVDVVYVDIAQPDQTEIAIENCHLFLKKGGYFFLVIKTRSIDVTKSPKKIIVQEIEKLETNFDILQSMDLYPYDKDHAMVIAKYRG